MSARYIALANEHIGTCRALRWAWLSIAPMVLADGDDPEEVSIKAQERRGDEITVIDTETWTPSRWWE